MNEQEILIKQNNLIIEQNEYLIRLIGELHDKVFGYEYWDDSYKELFLKAEETREFADNLLKEDVKERKLK